LRLPKVEGHDQSSSSRGVWQNKKRGGGLEKNGDQPVPQKRGHHSRAERKTAAPPSERKSGSAQTAPTSKRSPARIRSVKVRLGELRSGPRTFPGKKGKKIRPPLGRGTIG